MAEGAVALQDAVLPAATRRRPGEPDLAHAEGLWPVGPALGLPSVAACGARLGPRDRGLQRPTHRRPALLGCASRCADRRTAGRPQLRAAARLPPSAPAESPVDLYATDDRQRRPGGRVL